MSTSAEAGWVKAAELESGKIYSIFNYRGICHTCNGEVSAPFIFVMYIGCYQDRWGYEYNEFQNCFWTMCLSCRAYIDYVRIFERRALVLFEKEAADGRPH